MTIREGVIIPGKSIAQFVLGMTYETVSDMLNDDYSVYKDADSLLYQLTTQNAMFHFNQVNILVQIGVTIGFTSKLDNCIGIGSTMADVKRKYGGYYEEGDVYLIHGVEGICFELGDMDEIDDWDELVAPIEWIFVYDSDQNIEDTMKKIEDSYYWDSRVKALDCNYFGDEVKLVFEDDEKELTYHFEGCYSVKMEHVLEYQKEMASKDISRAQIPYFMQDVNLQEIVINKTKYMKFKINMFPMDVLIVCKKFSIY